MGDKTRHIQAAQLLADGKSPTEVGEILGVSRQRAKQLADIGRPLLDQPAPPPPEPPPADDPQVRFRIARAKKLEAEARTATMKADEQEGRLIGREVLDELLLELRGTIDAISNRMKKESPPSVEILREGMRRFDQWATQALGVK